MSMSRRKFLASLVALPAVCVAAAKAVAAQPPTPVLDLDKVFEVLYRVRAGREAGEYQLIVGGGGMILGMERVKKPIFLKYDVRTFKLKSAEYSLGDFRPEMHFIE